MRRCTNACPPSMSLPLRIVHCDDSADFIALVADWLEDHDDLDLVASALGMRVAIEQVREHQPDVVVTDTMGVYGAERYVTMLRESAPTAAIVLFTGYERFQLRAGIVELVDRAVTKGFDETELVDVLRSLGAS